MAHDDSCIGTWKNNKLGGNDDGDIKINDHNTNKISGKHINSGQTIDGTCNGKVQNFSRGTGGAKVKYKNGQISTVSAGKFAIKGKFSVGAAPALSAAKKSAKKGVKLTDPDDWTGEKTT